MTGGIKRKGTVVAVTLFVGCYLIPNSIVKLPKAEAQSPGQAIRGQDAQRQIDVGKERSSVKKIVAETRDGRKIHAAVRQPPAEGPFPAIVFIHGGLGQDGPVPFERLKDGLVRNPVYNRFLSAGYLCVASTFRDYSKNAQDRGPILDSLAIVEAVKELPAVDGESVVAYGGSGGGSIALELAGMTELAAVVTGEPATVIYTGMLTTGGYQMARKISQDYLAHYTPDLQKKTRAKIKTIACPILMLHGDVHALHKLNSKIVVPELKAAGKLVQFELYPGERHGFYFGRRTTIQTMGKVVSDVNQFLKRYLQTQPKPVKAGDERQAKSPEVVSEVQRKKSDTVAPVRERAMLKGHTAGIWSVAFSPDGKTLASGARDGEIKLWDTLTVRERVTLEGHSGPVAELAFSPDGKTLASGSEDRTIRLWQLE